MELALTLLGLVVAVGVVAGLADRRSLPTPLLLVVLGVVVSAVPGMPRIAIDPEVVLLGLLPPLLYSAAIKTSLVDFRDNKVILALMSVVLVGVTTVSVGLLAWWVTPAISLAAALALGAVVAPPDAVAATAVGKRIGMPRRLTAVLEDESLVNDAAALVSLTVAIAALTRAVGPGEVAWRFGLAAGGGVVIGVLVGIGLSLLRARIDDPVLDTTLSFAAPFVAFLPAQAIQSSGVLATVVTGLWLAHRAPSVQSARSRLAEATNWRTVAFLLENVVFLLIGLQLPALLDGVTTSRVSAGTVVVTCLVVLAVTVAVRFVFVFAVLAAFRAAHRDPGWGAAGAAVISWAGMRGVVTVAAAFLLPADTPQRSLLQLAAFTVVAGTLLVQGLTLPVLTRRLRLQGPDPAEDALQSASLVTTAVSAGLATLDRALRGDEPETVVTSLRDRALARSNAAWERLGRPDSEYEPPSSTYRRLRRAMLASERQVIVDARDEGRADDEVLRSALAAVDLEESLLEGTTDDLDTRRAEDELVPAGRGVAACAHLADAPRVVRVQTPGECPDCVREGLTWVHLRACLTCGQVGCCDSSVGRHAERHFHTTAHPVMRSVEPGEAWRWCYVDKQIG